VLPWEFASQVSDVFQVLHSLCDSAGRAVFCEGCFSAIPYVCSAKCQTDCCRAESAILKNPFPSQRTERNIKYCFSNAFVSRAFATQYIQCSLFTSVKSSTQCTLAFLLLRSY
jgi:hypothetical protein